MTPVALDLPVCFPSGRCLEFSPLEADLLNVLLPALPALPVVLAALGALVVAAVVVGVVRHRRRPMLAPLPVDLGERDSRALGAALLAAGGVLGLVAVLAPAALGALPRAATDAAALATGAGLVALGVRVPRPSRTALLLAGEAQAARVGIDGAQLASSASLGPWPALVATDLAAIGLLAAAIALAAEGRGLGVLRWILLLPGVTGLATVGLAATPIPAPHPAWLPVIGAVPALTLVVAGAALAPRHFGASGRMLRRTAAVGAGTLAVLALAAVVPSAPLGSVDPTPAAGEPALAPVPRITDPAEISLPIDRDVPTVADRDTILRAEDRLIAACTARSGVVWTASLVRAGSTTAVPYGSLFSVVDPAAASLSGYDGDFGFDLVPADPDPDPDAEPAAAAAVEATCVGRARTALHDDDTIEAMVEDASDDALDASEQDSRMRRVDAAWSRCMQVRGFDYASPAFARNDPRWHRIFPTADDVRTAQADVACTSATDLLGMRVAVAGAYERRYIAAHARRLAAAQADAAATLRLARQVLATG